MNLKLNRKSHLSCGVFSELLNENGELLAVTLEHAYFVGGDPAMDSKYAAKIPRGDYICKRGMHRLHGMTEDFETFQITGVEGHTDLLFHWGNYNKDSDGCVLVGESMQKIGSDYMIVRSKETFDKFMKLQQGVDSFTLTVT